MPYIKVNLHQIANKNNNISFTINNSVINISQMGERGSIGTQFMF